MTGLFPYENVVGSFAMLLLLYPPTDDNEDNDDDNDDDDGEDDDAGVSGSDVDVKKSGRRHRLLRHKLSLSDGESGDKKPASKGKKKKKKESKRKTKRKGQDTVCMGVPVEGGKGVGALLCSASMDQGTPFHRTLQTNVTVVELLCTVWQTLCSYSFFFFLSLSPPHFL